MEIKLGKSFSMCDFDKPKRGATYKWQDHAVITWNKLGLKSPPSKCFFRLFKTAYNQKRVSFLEQAYSFVSDASAYTPDRLFYWRYNQLVKISKEKKVTHQP